MFGHTIKFLTKDKVDFYLVIEPQEYELYRKNFPYIKPEKILTLDKDDGGTEYVRNYILDHSIALGFDRHWQLDDNITDVTRYHKGERFLCDSNIAFYTVEEYSDRYENVGISGLNYTMFAVNKCRYLLMNVHVYSFMLINNRCGFRFSGSMNLDTDICLQALTKGYCTVQFNHFTASKIQTMKVRGGNTDRYKGVGRYAMAKELENNWKQFVSVSFKNNRPQHHVAWQMFKHGLKRKPNYEELVNGFAKFKIVLFKTDASAVKMIIDIDKVKESV